MTLSLGSLLTVHIIFARIVGANNGSHYDGAYMTNAARTLIPLN